MPEGPVAGIDFGTCWSSVVVRRSDGSVVRVKEPVSGSASVPSSVVARDNGELLWGSAAENVKRSSPYQSQFKRRVGEREPLDLGGRGFTPVELVGGFLGWLRGLAEATVGQEVGSAVVTVPASYEGHRRDLMAHAATLAGFSTVELVAEPVAAARFASVDRPATPGERLVIYDLGGGTFDVAVVEIAETGARVLSENGLSDVGGTSFDRLVREDVLARDGAEELADALARSRRAPEEDDPKVRAKLLRPGLEFEDFSRKFKHQLSSATSHEDWVPHCDLLYELDRSSFEALIRPLVDETLACCDATVTESGLTWGDVDRIVLVGGSSKVPLVAAMLADRFHRPVQSVSDPELAIAEGAALPAATPPPDRMGDFLAEHPPGTVVTGWVIQHHPDCLYFDIDGILAFAANPGPDLDLGDSRNHQVAIVGSANGEELEVRLAAPPEVDTVHSLRTPTSDGLVADPGAPAPNFGAADLGPLGRSVPAKGDDPPAPAERRATHAVSRLTATHATTLKGGDPMAFDPEGGLIVSHFTSVERVVPDALVPWRVNVSAELGNVEACALGPDGGTVWLGGRDGGVIQVRLADGRAEPIGPAGARTGRRGPGRVKEFAFAGDTVLALHDGGQVRRLTGAAAGSVLTEGLGGVSSMQVVPGGRLALLQNRRVLLVDPRTGEQKSAVDVPASWHKTQSHLAADATGTLLAIASGQGTAIVAVDAGGCRLLWRDTSNSLHAPAFHPTLPLVAFIHGFKGRVVIVDIGRVHEGVVEPVTVVGLEAWHRRNTLAVAWGRSNELACASNTGGIGLFEVSAT